MVVIVTVFPPGGPTGSTPRASTLFGAFYREVGMARKTVLVSDLSGEEIPDGKGATVTINFRDARKGVVVLDVTDSEADQMGAKGRQQARRGRRPFRKFQVGRADRGSRNLRRWLTDSLDARTACPLLVRQGDAAP